MNSFPDQEPDVIVRCQCGERVAHRLTFVVSSPKTATGEWAQNVYFWSSTAPDWFREQGGHNASTKNFMVDLALNHTSRGSSEALLREERLKAASKPEPWSPICRRCGASFTLLAIKKIIKKADRTGKRNVQIQASQGEAL